MFEQALVAFHKLQNVAFKQFEDVLGALLKVEKEN